MTHTESNTPTFLTGVPLRPVKLPDGSPFRSIGLVLGNGSSALEVLIASHDRPPPLPAVRSTWKARKGARGFHSYIRRSEEFITP